MRLLLTLLPALALAQTPPAATPAVPTPASAPAPAKKSPAAATTPANAAAPKPATQAKPAAPGTLATDDEKTIYAMGLAISRQLAAFSLTPSELDIVRRALSDAAAGKPEIDLNVWGPKIQSFAATRAAAAAEKEKAASAAYLTKASAEPGAIKTESGLVYRELTAGTGDFPKATDTVKVHYRGTLTNGTEFDSSYKRNEPAQFPLTNVIKCWTEGVQRMKVGGKSMLVCPSDIAYGNMGHPPSIPGGATLVFEIELLEIGAAKAPAPAPAPVAPPPAPAPKPPVK
jgi:FKBP-type peptidyl-prolyl cis-trans isomerase FkpA